MAAPQIETVHVEGKHLVERIRQLIHEGNVRKITVRHEGHIVVEMPLTVGIVGVIVAPLLAAAGGIAAAVTDCTLDIERSDNGTPSEMSAGGQAGDVDSTAATSR